MKYYLRNTNHAYFRSKFSHNRICPTQRQQGRFHQVISATKKRFDGKSPVRMLPTNVKDFLKKISLCFFYKYFLYFKSNCIALFKTVLKF